MKDRAPAVTLPQIRLLLETVLPLKMYSVQETIELVKWIQEKNHKAYLSHRKQKLGQELSEDEFLMNSVT